MEYLCPDQEFSYLEEEEEDEEENLQIILKLHILCHVLGANCNS